MASCIANAPAIGLVTTAASGSAGPTWNPPEPPDPISLNWNFVTVPHYTSPDALNTEKATFDTPPPIPGDITYGKPTAPYIVEGGTTIDPPATNYDDLGPFEANLEPYVAPEKPDDFAGTNPGTHSVSNVPAPGTVTVPTTDAPGCDIGSTPEPADIGVTVEDVDVTVPVIADKSFTGAGVIVGDVGDVTAPEAFSGPTVDTTVDTDGLGDYGNIDGIGYIDPRVGLGDISLSLVGALVPADIGDISIDGLGDISPDPLNLPEFDEVAPDVDIIFPEVDFNYDPGVFTTTVLDDTIVEIQRMLNGDIAIPEAVWQDMYNRAVEREDASTTRLVDEVTSGYAAMGWAGLGGALDKRVREARQKGFDARNQVNRDVFIKHAEVELESMKFAITQGIAAEQILANLFIALEELKYKAATMRSQITIQYVEAQVAVLNAEVALFGAKASVYKTIIEAEIAKLEQYRILLEADRVKLDAQKVRLEGDRVYLDGQRLTIENDQLLIDGQKLELESDKVVLADHSLTLDSHKVRLDAANTMLAGDEVEIRGQQLKLDGGKLQIDVARLDIEGKGLEIEGKRLELEGDKVELQGLQTKLESDKVKITADGVDLENRKIQVSAAGAATDRARAITDAANAEIANDRNKLTGKELEIRAKSLLIDCQKTNIEAYNAKVRALAVAVDEHNTQVAAMRGSIDLENAKVASFKASVDAYGTEAQVYAAEWSGFASATQGELAKAEFYKAAASGYASEVGAFKAAVEAESARIEADAKVIQVDLERMKSDSQRFAEESRGEAARVSSLADVYRTNMSGYEALASVHTAQSQAYSDRLRVEVANAQAAATAGIEGARISASQENAYGQALAGAQDTVTRVNGQLAASELGRFHATASTGHSARWSTTCDI